MFSELEFYVRYAETDAMGVVHHASYLVYMEEARSHFARERGQSYADFEASGYFLVVSEVEMRLVAPARYGDKLRVKISVEEFKSRRITFGYEIYETKANTLLVQATTRHICINKAGQLSVIPETWRKVWAGDVTS